MRPKSALVRKTWPKIRKVLRDGDTYFQVDARRQGTAGKQETFKSRAAAEKRAGEIEREFAANGNDGLALSGELRGLTLLANELLQPYGKTILEAAQFYRAHLDSEKERQDSAMAPTLANQWYEEKKAGKNKQLRATTLKGILDAKRILETEFATKRILDLKAKDIRHYLDNIDVSLRRKFNIQSLFSQFFNWCIAHGHLQENPCEKIDIHVPTKEVSILSPTDAVNLLSACEKQFPDLLLYHAIGLFAGLRPNECLLLKWEDIHFQENTIFVHGRTSKTKESRSVPIEPNLKDWLWTLTPEPATGLVTSNRNFIKRTKELHAALGYRAGGENATAQAWPQDVLRHSYGSYWLAKHKQRATLAENMGNSVEIIKKHYKRVVSNSAFKEFWAIKPGLLLSPKAPLSHEDERRLRMDRVLAETFAESSKTDQGQEPNA
jgi:integrase